MTGVSVAIAADTVWETFRSDYEVIAPASGEGAVPIGNERLAGSSGDDVPYAADAADMVARGAGDDLSGGSASLANFMIAISIPEAGCMAEVLIDDEGDGAAIGGAGTVVLYGGKGTDITESGGADPEPTSEVLFGSKSSGNVLFGSKSSETLGHDALNGSDSNDWLSGGEGDDAAGWCR